MSRTHCNRNSEIVKRDIAIQSQPLSLDRTRTIDHSSIWNFGDRVLVLTRTLNIRHREIAIRDFPIRHIACGPPRSQWRTGVRSTEEVRIDIS
jgi:hypothetical protein